MLAFAEDIEGPETTVASALNTLAQLISARPSETTLRSLQASAYTIITLARASRCEAMGIAAHMLCNHIDSLLTAGTWNIDGVRAHHDAMRSLVPSLDRAEVDRILQDLLKLSPSPPATAA